MTSQLLECGPRHWQWVRRDVVGGSTCGYRRFTLLERSRLRRSHFRLERNHCRRMTNRSPMLRYMLGRPKRALPARFGSRLDIFRAANGALPIVRPGTLSRLDGVAGKSGAQSSALLPASWCTQRFRDVPRAKRGPMTLNQNCLATSRAGERPGRSWRDYRDAARQVDRARVRHRVGDRRANRSQPLDGWDVDDAAAALAFMTDASALTPPRRLNSLGRADRLPRRRARPRGQCYEMPRRN